MGHGEGGVVSKRLEFRVDRYSSVHVLLVLVVIMILMGLHFCHGSRRSNAYVTEFNVMIWMLQCCNVTVIHYVLILISLV